jgi:hypothetical protein
MAYYDGPAFARDGQKPEPTTAQKAQEPITYHSVDPMSQFVTPPSVASRMSKAPVIDYADITAKMRRADDAVILLAPAAEDDVSPVATEAASESPAVETTPTPASAQPAQADAVPVVKTVQAAAETTVSQADPAAAQQATPVATATDEWWPVEVEAAQPVLRDDSPESQQHRSTVSALTPRTAPLPDWNETHNAVAAYLRNKQH